MHSARFVRVAIVFFAAVATVISGISILPATAATSAYGSIFIPVQSRLLDTRSGSPAAPGDVISIKVSGNYGIPSQGVIAAVVTLTSVSPSGAGWLSSSPGTSALSYNDGDTVSNTAIMRLDSTGSISLSVNQSGTHLIVDVQGYFKSSASVGAGGFTPVSPVRIADSRYGQNLPMGKIATGSVVSVPVAGSGRAAPATAKSAILGISISGQSGPGYIVAYANGEARPANQSLNFDSSESRTISVAAPIGVDGKVNIAVIAGGPLDVSVDLQGYSDGSSSFGQTALNPTSSRIYDSRSVSEFPLGPGEVRTVQVAGIGGVPTWAAGTDAVAINFTTSRISPAARGYLQAWGTDDQGTQTSVLNYDGSDEYRSTLAIVRPGRDGMINVKNSGSGEIHLVLDSQAWFANSASDLDTRLWRGSGSATAEQLAARQGIPRNVKEALLRVKLGEATSSDVALIEEAGVSELADQLAPSEGSVEGTSEVGSDDPATAPPAGSAAPSRSWCGWFSGSISKKSFLRTSTMFTYTYTLDVCSDTRKLTRVNKNYYTLRRSANVYDRGVKEQYLLPATSASYIGYGYTAGYRRIEAENCVLRWGCVGSVYPWVRIYVTAGYRSSITRGIA